MCSNSCFGHDWRLRLALCRIECSPGALQSIPSRILTDHQVGNATYADSSTFFLIQHLEPYQRPRYSSEFTINPIAYYEAASKIVHSGSFHTIAMYHPLFSVVCADPYKTNNQEISPSSTLGGEIDLLSLCASLERWRPAARPPRVEVLCWPRGYRVF